VVAHLLAGASFGELALMQVHGPSLISSLSTFDQHQLAVHALHHA